MSHFKFYSAHEQEMNEADYVISVVAGNPSENLINSNAKFFHNIV